MKHTIGNSIQIFMSNLIAIVVAYYVAILLHEWGHGTVAWLYGVKSSPFDVQYGGWLLLHADENVTYTNLINSGRGVAAALIGIAGASVSLILAMISFILLSRISLQNHRATFIFTYWFLIINMIPLVQYFSISTFSSEGDVGRFIHGLNISGWYVFIPGTVFIIFSLWKILTIEIPKCYAVIPVTSLLGKNIFLLATLSIIFLFIYTHGYNPMTDEGMNTTGKIMAVISILLVPLLFALCYPSRDWVVKAGKSRVD